MCFVCFFFFFKQKTAYEMRISDWSSDVCSSDLPNAQAELIRDCLQKAGIDARSVSYLEAHGTGTELGDPIEIAGLTAAFRHDRSEERRVGKECVSTCRFRWSPYH